MADTTYSARPAEEADRAFIREMFVLTETWGEPDGELPENFDDDLDRDVEGGEPAEGGVVLVEVPGAGEGTSPERRSGEALPGDADAARVGDAWLRRLTDDDPGYGYVADEYPELAIAVRAGREGRGLGSRLLAEVLRQARELGYPGISLSVENGNDRARRAYEKAGFEDLGPDDLGGHTMLYRFDGEAEGDG